MFSEVKFESSVSFEVSDTNNGIIVTSYFVGQHHIETWNKDTERKEKPTFVGLKHVQSFLLFFFNCPGLWLQSSIILWALRPLQHQNIPCDKERQCSMFLVINQPSLLLFLCQELLNFLTIFKLLVLGEILA